jgi:hypothetical protein
MDMKIKMQVEMEKARREMERTHEDKRRSFEIAQRAMSGEFEGERVERPMSGGSEGERVEPKHHGFYPPLEPADSESLGSEDSVRSGTPSEYVANIKDQKEITRALDQVCASCLAHL